LLLNSFSHFFKRFASSHYDFRHPFGLSEIFVGLIALFKFSRNTRDDRFPVETPPSKKTAQFRLPDYLRSADYGIRINAGSHLKRCTLCRRASLNEHHVFRMIIYYITRFSLCQVLF